MSILNKLMDTMRLTENDDDYFDEEDYEEEKPVIKKRSFGKRDEEMDVGMDVRWRVLKQPISLN